MIHQINWDSAETRFAILSYWTGYATAAESSVSAKNGWKITRSGESRKFTLHFRHDGLNMEFDLEVEERSDGVRILLPKASLKEPGSNKFGSILFLPDLLLHHEGDQGYYILPQQSGVISNFCGKQEMVHKIGIYGSGMSECNMPILGMEEPDGVFCAILGPGECDAALELATAQGREREYRLAFRLFFRYEFNVRRQNYPMVNEDFCLTLAKIPHDGRHPAALLAEYYRNWRMEKGEIRSLSERVKTSPELLNAVKSPEVRIRLAVKWPIPMTVVEQTPENEPAVHVFCNFDQVREMVDSFKAAGIEHLNICLVGWSAKGHDGRYPQILPVEETLGGESKLRELIAYTQKAGYFITAHDNHCDAYGISEDPIEDLLVLSQEDTPLKDGIWGGGQSWKSCPEAMYKTYSGRNYQIIRDLGFRGTHFTDCLSTIGLSICWSRKHPATKSQTAYWRRKILELAKEKIGSIESEGCFDFAASVLDRCLYIQSDGGRADGYLCRQDYVDGIVPLYEMTYHGILLYNVYGESINSVRGSYSYLLNLAFGGMPSFYFYRHFATRNWNSDGTPVEGHFETRDFHLGRIREESAQIREAEEDYVGCLGSLQYCFIRDYRKLSDTVSRTDYSDGSSVYVNFGTEDAKFDGVSVPAAGYFLQKRNS